MDFQETTPKQKPRKPRRQPEVLEVPRRYAVRLNGATPFEVRADSKEEVQRMYRSPEAHLMGTHESLKQATHRLGW